MKYIVVVEEVARYQVEVDTADTDEAYREAINRIIEDGSGKYFQAVEDRRVTAVIPCVNSEERAS